jgi:hypothetical protein
MPISLAKDLRKLLERTTAAARVLAESACRAALENLAVHEKEYRAHMSVEQRLLRNRLRARGRALGDRRDERSGIQDIRYLMELAAYEHWHRLLFTRFLTENHLLITDEVNGSVPVTLEECEELAPELRARDGLDLACRFAGLILPGVFRRDDPVLDLPVALNDQVELRKLLATLPVEVFQADDSLGWTYQFWQAQRKKEVNDSSKKKGANELSPVTQFFTEDYMVEFLLHNTLGAWWAGKRGPIQADSEEEARAYAALLSSEGVPAISWTYLRFVQDETARTWLPAAGTFDGWPKAAALIRLLDPCMGSGHFLVFALPLLVRLRMEEEKLSAQAAVVASLKDNIHGLELDERCTQIAAFNVALTAWKLAGYQVLPSLNLACSGLAPSATEAEWVALAGDSERARNGMVSLHRLFKDAPVLGSLITPRAQGGKLFVAEFHELAPLLTVALAQSENQKTKLENDDVELAVIAQGQAKATELLTDQFTLVITNVPYLGREGHCDELVRYADRYSPHAAADLATLMVERCLELLSKNGDLAVVLPHNWWVGKAYRDFRHSFLPKTKWRMAVVLGEEAWETFGNRGPNTILLVADKGRPIPDNKFFALDVATKPRMPVVDRATKALALAGALDLTNRLGTMFSVTQLSPLQSRDARISLAEIGNHAPLSQFVISGEGCSTGDNDRYMRGWWEVADNKDWLEYCGPGFAAQINCDSSLVIYWQEGKGSLAMSDQARIQNTELWKKKGILVGRVRGVSATLFSGGSYSKGAVLICPKKQEHILPILTFLRSEEYERTVRQMDPRVSAATSILTAVPFNFAHWQIIATEKHPDGLPQPYSNDPTQWLFNGYPAESTQPLQVAVARLLGYRWPRQTGSSFPDCPALGPDGLEPFVDEDGIVCLPPLNREQPAAGRLRQFLTTALGTFDERALIAAAGLKGSKATTLEDWLRDEFFEQHVKLFHDRPFIWHLWDGRPDGFHVLVNYHKLDHATLQKLTYSYLGDWIRQQDEDAKADKPGAAARLGAARALQAKLAAIFEGEAPLDIFVRWKPLKEQAQGWNPDLNDGIRQNIRPFLLAGDVGKKGAGLFRTVPLKLKDKDRGNEPQRPKAGYPWFWCEEEPGTDPFGSKDFVGTRWNAVHLTLARKKEACS